MTITDVRAHNLETDIEDPGLEKPYYEEPVEDPETEDDIVNGVDDNEEDGLPPEDES